MEDPFEKKRGSIHRLFYTKAIIEGISLYIKQKTQMAPWPYVLVYFLEIGYRTFRS